MYVANKGIVGLSWEDEDNPFKDEFADVTLTSDQNDVLKRMIAAYLSREPDKRPRLRRSTVTKGLDVLAREV